MKNKKLIIGLGLGIGAYLLWKLNRKKSSGVVNEVPKPIEKAIQKAVKPKGEEIFRGVNTSQKNARIQNRQYVSIGSNKVHPILGLPKTNFAWLQKGQDFEVENSKGERKKIVGYTFHSILLDVPVADNGTGGWLEKGEDYKIFKV